MDYKNLNFKCGLELHQQIEGKKLFCNCPTIIKEGNPNFVFKRKLRASASELGKIDEAALHELKKGKYFVYDFYDDSNCLVCTDDEPPGELNKNALDISLICALLLNCKIVDEVQFMRKVVIDGSNVSSFQRTSIIGYNGYIETSKGRVGIQTICLEEEAAKKVEDNEEYRRYNLSRLGIPLIEIATNADIKDPEHAKETAEKIGMVLRSIDGIKRGIGSIRQDVNLSINNLARVEIKGFQDYRNIPKVIENEIKRQLDLINKGEKLKPEVRGAREDFTTRFERPMPGASRMYPETDIPTIKISKDYLEKIKLPELISEKIENLEEKYGINAEIARQLVKENKLELFKELIIYGDPKLIAKTLVLTLKDIKARLNVDINKLKKEDFILIFKNIKEGKINKNAIENVLVDILKGEKFNLELYKGVNEKEIEKEIKKIIGVNRDLPIGGIMGRVMDKYRGLVDGKKVMEMIKELK